MSNDQLELIKNAIRAVIEKHYKQEKNYDELFYTCCAEVVFTINGCNQKIHNLYAYAYTIAQPIVKKRIMDDLMKMDGKKYEE